MESYQDHHLPIQNWSKPTKTRPVLSVGVIGHTSEHSGWVNKIDQITEQAINILKNIPEEANNILQASKDNANYFYIREESLNLRVISILNEGGTTLLTNLALDQGYELTSVLPFEKIAYMNDFSGSTLIEFESLLKNSRHRIELSSSREENKKNEGYVDAVKIMIHHSDVLVALWDGKISGQNDYVAEAVANARMIGIPVIWLNFNRPDEISILEYGHTKGEFGRLHRYLSQILLPIRNSDQDWLNHDGKRYRSYLTESRKFFNSNFSADLFESLVSLRFQLSLPFYVGHFKRKMAKRNHHILYDVNIAENHDFYINLSQILNRFDTHLGWSLHLSQYYTGLQRSVYINTFLLGIGIVGVAIYNAVVSNPKFWGGIEIGFVSAILMLFAFKDLNKWKQKEHDHRLLAVSLKSQLLLAPIYMTNKLRDIHYVNTKAIDIGRNWANVHFRALLRHVGPISGRINTDYLHAYRLFLLDAIDEEIQHQIGYSFSGGIFKRSKDVKSGLVATSIICFGFAIFASVFQMFGNPQYFNKLYLAMGMLPILGIGCLSIASLGQYDLKKDQAEHLALQLMELRVQVEKCKEKNLPEVAIKVSELFVDHADIIKIKF